MVSKMLARVPSFFACGIWSQAGLFLAPALVADFLHIYLIG
jgi:hypothetical protein